MSLLAELRRRNVIRVAGLYLVGAWLITQVASTLLPLFDAPVWVTRSIVIVLALGFVPMLVFSWFYELTPAGWKRDADLPPAPAAGGDTARRIDRAIIVVLLVALAYFAVDKFVLSRRASTPGIAAAAPGITGATAASHPAVSDKSIAVLPLVNEGGAADEQYFSDGLSADLITALSQFSGLKVIGRNSSFQFRDSKDDSRAIAAKLGVAHLFTGAVRRDGDVVRIRAELIDAADGSTQWSQHYDRPYKDLFALQDEIAQAVATALKAKLLAGSGATQSERPPSGNLDAYNAFLQGWFFYARRTEPDLKKAIDQFELATRIDPSYAYAWGTASRTWITFATSFLEGEAAQSAYAQGRASADKALALAPDLAVGHIARGFVLQTVDLDWAAAESEYERARQLAPDDPTPRFALGLITATLGRPDEAATLIKAALSADPLHASWYGTYADVLNGLGRGDEAESAIRKAIELQPGATLYHRILAGIAIARGDAAAAEASAQQEPPGLWHDVALAEARQIGTDRHAADAALDVLIEHHAHNAAYQIARTYALRRDADRTFEWLDRAHSQRDSGLGHLLYDPMMSPFRSDARFAAFCRSVGLPEPR